MPQLKSDGVLKPNRNGHLVFHNLEKFSHVPQLKSDEDIGGDTQVVYFNTDSLPLSESVVVGSSLWSIGLGSSDLKSSPRLLISTYKTSRFRISEQTLDICYQSDFTGV